MSGAEGVCIRSGTILPPWIEKVKRKHPKQKKKHRKPVLFLLTAAPTDFVRQER